MSVDVGGVCTFVGYGGKFVDVEGSVVVSGGWLECSIRSGSLS